MVGINNICNQCFEEFFRRQRIIFLKPSTLFQDHPSFVGGYLFKWRRNIGDKFQFFRKFLCWTVASVNCIAIKFIGSEKLPLMEVSLLVKNSPLWIIPGL